MKQLLFLGLFAWRFNNVQPVVRPDGSTVDGLLLYYGWKDPNAPEATAFLVHEAVNHVNADSSSL